MHRVVSTVEDTFGAVQFFSSIISECGALKMGLRILIVDDHEPTRRAITSILAKRADWHVCGEASDGMDAITQAEKLRPDAVLMDVSMPRMDGLQATREVRQHPPTTKIIIVSQNDPSVVRQQAEQVRADAFCSVDFFQPN
jgi:DNA-binding NarL/FixJ family response regulator